MKVRIPGAQGNIHRFGTLFLDLVLKLRVTEEGKEKNLATDESRPDNWILILPL